MDKIYLKLVIKKPGNLDLNMSLEDIRKIPCHFLKVTEYEEKLICIEHRSAGVSQASLAAMHLKYLARKYNVVRWELLHADQLGAVENKNKNEN